MQAVIIYNSLTGTTEKAAYRLASELRALRMIARAGTPTAVESLGMSVTTTAPEPIETLSPTCTGPSTHVCAPSITWSPMTGSPGAEPAPTVHT